MICGQPGKRRGFKRRPGHALIGPGHQRKAQPPGQRKAAKPGMKHEQKPDEQGRPGRIVKRKQHRRGPEPRHGIKVLPGRNRNGVPGVDAKPAKGGGQDPAVKRDPQSGTDPRHDAPARLIKDAHDQEQERRKTRQGDQRLDRAGDQHPVIDLQHVKRRSQHQKVHRHRKAECRRYRRGRGGPDGGDGVPLRAAVGHAVASRHGHSLRTIPPWVTLTRRFIVVGGLAEPYVLAAAPNHRPNHRKLEAWV